MTKDERKAKELNIPIFGEKKPGKQPTEAAEMVTFFNELKKQYPHLHAAAVHIRNEGKRHWAQAQKEKAEGMNVGASDILIPGNPSLCIELKSCSKQAKGASKHQWEYLIAARELGSFVCVAYGWKGAIDAINKLLCK